jgi:ABC-type multidrug transport system permease subunit
MRHWYALADVTFKLSVRERTVLFFNYVFPLLFFFLFGQFARERGDSANMIAMVLVFAILGNGLFGAGVRTVADREANVLRRFKVAPITPMPLLVASLATGWLLMIPAIVFTVVLAHVVYDVPWPAEWGSLIALLSLGTLAMRSIGLIVASVANTVSESNILVQLIYIPMLFLSGATLPVASMPGWAQAVSAFLPSTHLFNAVQGLTVRGERIGDHLPAVAALAVTTVVATFVSSQLFRWEKGERVPNRAKAWIAVALLPFVILGLFDAASR